MRFTTMVRDELARVAPGDPAACLAEIAAALRVGGALRLGHGTVGLVVTTSDPAVARRLRGGMLDLSGTPPRIEVHAPHGLAPSTRYRLLWQPADPAALVQVGVLDEQGRPCRGLPARVVAASPAAALRGAMMLAGSVSDPAGPPHLEVPAPGRSSAEELAELMRLAGAPRAQAAPHGEVWRAVVKSRSGIAAVLARTGARTALLRYDQGRVRRELRGHANRAANADRANVQRSVAASSRQVRAVEAALVRGDLEHLAPELVEVALARLANPQASLEELGALLNPPVGKVTVHRRLARLEALGSSPRA